MKKTQLALLALLFTFIGTLKSLGQNNWISLSNNKGKFSFKMPENPQTYDTLRVAVYIYSTEDTALVLQVYYLDSAYLESSPEYNSICDLSKEKDPLSIIAKIFIYSQEAGELISYKKINKDKECKLDGVEIGIKTEENNNSIFTFTQIYFERGRFISFVGSTTKKHLKKQLPLIKGFFSTIKISS